MKKALQNTYRTYYINSNMTGNHKSWQKTNTIEKKTLNKKNNLVNNIYLLDQTNNTVPIGDVYTGNNITIHL